MIFNNKLDRCFHTDFNEVFFQGDFGTQKEAAWAISNLTISGRKDQVCVVGFQMVTEMLHMQPFVRSTMLKAHYFFSLFRLNTLYSKM